MVTVEEILNNQQKGKAPKTQRAELNEQAVHNLVGFFDVLIQMDFAQKQKQRNERNDEDGNDFQSTTSVAA
ncbi:MAG: hypothetical protein JWN12_51 [Candidatus Saccharibacteria bacterium]|nr:hypothetical protein [Candidatus Saccharibacteria bacterium]